MNIIENIGCNYCGTEFTIHFDREEDKLLYCPSCGEQFPEEQEDYEELDFD
jgi:uncharacterized Zn-finger protein